MTRSQLLAFVIAAEALLIVPGPSVLFVVSRGVTYGRRAAISTVVGNTAGTALQAIAVAAGLGAIVATSTAVFTTMKVAGGLYLVWLGIRAWRDRRSLADALRAGAVVPVRSSRVLLRDGFLVGVTNPKTTLFFLAVLPQFVRADGASASVQLLVLGLVFCAMALVSDGAYGMVAGTVRGWLERSPRRVQALGAAGAAVMVGLGVNLALSGRKD